MGAGNLPRTVKALLPVIPENAALQVVTGDNAQARYEIEKICDSRLNVYGRVAPLTDLICGADLLITKSGGLTTSEAMVLGTPMLIYQAIEGCETINAALFERNGLSLWARSEQSLQEKVHYLLTHPGACDDMVKKQAEQIPEHPSRRCADLLIEEVKKRA